MNGGTPSPILTVWLDLKTHQFQGGHGQIHSHMLAYLKALKSWVQQFCNRV